MTYCGRSTSVYKCRVLPMMFVQPTQTVQTAAAVVVSRRRWLAQTVRVLVVVLSTAATPVSFRRQSAAVNTL